MFDRACLSRVFRTGSTTTAKGIDGEGDRCRAYPVYHIKTLHCTRGVASAELPYRLETSDIGGKTRHSSTDMNVPGAMLRRQPGALSAKLLTRGGWR